MRKPLISVLIPAYNHELYVKETIQSIWNQQYSEIEIILVDDGSTDRTAEIAESLKRDSVIAMKVIRQSNQGITKTLNKALSEATGDYVAFIASDDVFSPLRFQRQIDLMERCPKLQVVYANGKRFSGKIIGSRIHDMKTVQLLNCNKPSQILFYLQTNIPHLFIQTCLFRRSFLTSIGGFDEDLLLDDWPLNIRIFQAISEDPEAYAYIDEDVVYYRQHETNSFQNITFQTMRIVQVVNKYTPAQIRKTVLSNIFWIRCKAAMKARNLELAIRYFSNSQQHKINIVRLFSFLAKLIAYPWK